METRWHHIERNRFFVALCAAVAFGVPTAAISPWQLSLLIAWDVAALVFLVWTWTHIVRMDAATTRAHAQREDATRDANRVLMLVAAMASLGGVVTALILGKHTTGSLSTALVVVAIVTVMISWTLIHTLFALRYADMYYAMDPPGGMSFNSDQPPDFRDFAYVAFTMGVAYQLSDTELSDQRVRRTVLVHSLLAYVFGTVIIGLTISLVAGLFG